MDSIVVKVILAIFFIGAGIAAVLFMFALMGKAERRMSATFLRRAHKTAGGIFTILLILISYFCIKRVGIIGDDLATRSVFHGVLALALIGVLAVKIAIVQFYKELMRFVPALGIMVFVLAFVVFSTSAGYYLVRQCANPARQESAALETPSQRTGGQEAGKALFANKCSFCHYADRRETKIGPGLKELLRRETLPYSKRPATAANVESQIRNPVDTMPGFGSLTDEEIADLLEFLKGL